MRFIWVNGELTNWENAQVHVWDEIAIRGVSAFEGIICTWHQKSNSHLVIAGKEHYRRLQRSSSIIDIPIPFTYDELRKVLKEASEKLKRHNIYLRPTTYVLKGRTSLAKDLKLGWFVGAFPLDLKKKEEVLNASIMWPSRSSSMIPPDAKTGGSYLDFRLVQKNRILNGIDISLMVDDRGNLVEADGNGLLIVDEGKILVPNVSGHALDSITRKILIDLAVDSGFTVINKDVHLHRLMVVLF
ncbi:MAG: aminotransferase class IV [Flavobacteriaceae bacterium]|nr:aminotransferase class IV [Flavobacteriaceae bacterium]